MCFRIKDTSLCSNEIDIGESIPSKKHQRCWAWSKTHLLAIYQIEAEPKINYIIRTFRVSKSSGARKQSPTSQKVNFSNWYPFFDLIHFRPWPAPLQGLLWGSRLTGFEIYNNFFLSL